VISPKNEGMPKSIKGGYDYQYQYRLKSSNVEGPGKARSTQVRSALAKSID